jgi:Cu(I)/Ag(I) efflux system membrane fusion protein
MDLVLKEDEHENHKSITKGKEEKSELNLVDPEQNNYKQNKMDIADSIEIDEEKQFSIGVKIFKVTRKALQKKIFSAGKVAYDPELYTAILEHREAIQNSNEEKSPTLLNATTQKLKQMGLSDWQIKDWSNPAKDPSVLVNGGKNGRSYLYSQIYESDIALIKQGQRVEAKASAFSDKIFQGSIKSIDTILDGKNRTLRIRSEVNDPELVLRPQMYVEVIITVQIPAGLVIPKLAVIDTGIRKLVYIRKDKINFKPQPIEVNFETDDYFGVSKGLDEGDEIAFGANFLIDSETKIRLGNSEGHSH